MTDRHSAYLVTLKDDIREDDSEALLNAIRLIRGVIKVEPVESDVTAQIAEIRVRNELRERLINLWERPNHRDRRD